MSPMVYDDGYNSKGWLTVHELYIMDTCNYAHTNGYYLRLGISTYSSLPL